ncbi:hypothetical protein HYR99_17455 [Candidatus Poribacteria bacterium]|nr:hypothetical protein [Candidatus Poribacteria bacterium]
MADLGIQVGTSKSEYAFGEALLLTYTATNISQGALFVVTDKDRIYKIKESDRLLRVVISQIKPMIDFDYFAFQPPKLRKLRPGASISSKLSIGMPLQDSVLGPNGRVELVEMDFFGDIEVRLEVGYGTQRFRPTSVDLFREFLSWQKFSASRPIKIHIAARGPIQPVTQ